ncbi:MAG: hypothetical protein QOE37_2354 [Microbacteriaceae bacterium]|jgi:hypothetical protein|nr:hypothetical protein [Microbacteriaceae bacterium]
MTSRSISPVQRDQHIDLDRYGGQRGEITQVIIESPSKRGSTAETSSRLHLRDTPKLANETHGSFRPEPGTRHYADALGTGGLNPG